MREPSASSRRHRLPHFARETDAEHTAIVLRRRNHDSVAGLAYLTMPVGIVVGEEDDATPPAMAEAMKAAIPQAGYRLLPKARHPTPLERRDEASEEIFAVIAKAQGGRGKAVILRGW